MNFKSIIILLSIIFIYTQTAFSQKQGKIAGKVIEAQTGFEIIGATIYISNATNIGTSTDLDGKYLLELTEGTYNLECSYLGFETKKLTGILIKANEVLNLDIKLGEAAIDLNLNITVEAQRAQNTETALLTMQKQSISVIDGISASQITKTDDRDAASALRRVTGVTIEGGKYVYIRGLGDRYSKTTLNGAEVPSLDPNRNTVQMDLFPTNLIDNMLVYKTFSPDLYGDFAGGYIDVVTKDFPDKKTFQINFSLGFNSLATFNKNFITSPRGKLDWLGFDDGGRSIPKDIQNAQNNFPTYQEGINSPNTAQQLSSLTSSFTNRWAQTTQMMPFNHNFNILFGNQTKLFGRQLGYVAALTYQRQFNFYENGEYAIYELSGMYNTSNKLTPQLQLKDTKSEDDVLWGAMLNTSYKINPNNKISLSFMHNQGATNTTRSLSGLKQRDDASDIFQTKTWSFLQRGLTTVQLRGKHIVKELKDLEITWQSSYAHSTQTEPDLHYFTNRYNSPSGVYFIKPSSDRTPSRFYRDMTQQNIVHRLDISLPFVSWTSSKGFVKIGGAHIYKSRAFHEDRYTFENQNYVFNGHPATYFADSNLLKANAEGSGYSNNGQGIYVVKNLDPANSYTAQQQVAAGYAMTEVPLLKKLRAVIGGRMEYTNVKLYSFSELVRTRYPQTDGKTALLDNIDILPALTLNYEINSKVKLRAAYSRTLARPTFRELAPFASFDVDGGYLIVGNPNLQRTNIDNADFRAEWYPSVNEIVSVSAFYKHFKNPIERTFNPEQANGEFTFRNVPEANLVGIEAEFRKNLGFIGTFMNNFSVAVNASYIYSRTKIDTRELQAIRAAYPESPATRQMFGQSPYNINALLSYQSQKGTAFNIAFNIIGKRLSYITINATPDIYELPRPMLNANFSQRLNKHFTIKVSGNNLLNAKFREQLQFKNVSYITAMNPLGFNFSIGIKYDL